MLLLCLGSVGLFCLMLWWSRKTLKQSEDEKNATFCHCDMYSKFWEMLADESTTYDDWYNFLPVAGWADSWWNRTHPYCSPMNLQLDVAKVLRYY